MIDAHSRPRRCTVRVGSRLRMLSTSRKLRPAACTRRATWPDLACSKPSVCTDRITRLFTEPGLTTCSSAVLGAAALRAAERLVRSRQPKL
eukprot:7384734-Prymnesium_polylepis.2